MMTTYELRNKLQEELNMIAKKIPLIEKELRLELNDRTLNALDDAYKRRKELENALVLIGQFER